MPSIRRCRTGRWPLVVAILIVLAAAAACSSGGATGAAPAASQGAAPRALDQTGANYSAEVAAGPVSPTTGGNDTGGGGNPQQYGPDEQGLLIIKNGTMTLQVAGIDAALKQATQQITTLGGYVSGSDRSGDGDSAFASITFRIPATRWDEALAGLRGLAVKVVEEHSTTEDVTTQVVDLAARIANLQATEHALQGIMDRAREIKDVLAVQEQLTEVRGQIEQMTAEKTQLQQHAAMSTLNVSFELKPNPVRTEQQQFDPGAEAEQASASLVSALQGLAKAGIWFAIVWIPVLLFLALVGGIAWFVVRRVRGSGNGGDPGGGPTEPSSPRGPNEPNAPVAEGTA